MSKTRLERDIKLIAFDADDTLWINEFYYRRAENNFAKMLSGYCSHEVAIEALLRKEKENLSLLGYGSKAFTLSLIECAIELSQGAITAHQIQELIEIGKATIARKIELMPNSKQTLSTLHLEYPLVLATKGDLKEQEAKVEKSGLGSYFSSIEIMSEKNPESYLKILKQNQIEPQNFLMVGNSFKSDILPVLEIGGNAIYIPAEITWAHELVEEFEHPNLIKTDDIINVPKLFATKKERYDSI